MGEKYFKIYIAQKSSFFANLQCVGKHLERPEVEGALRHGHCSGGDPPPLGGKQLAQEDVGHGAVAGRIRLGNRFCIQRFRSKLCGKLFRTSTNRQSASAVAAADALAPNTAAPSAASAAAAALEAAMPRAEHTRRVRRQEGGGRQQVTYGGAKRNNHFDN